MRRISSRVRWTAPVGAVAVLGIAAGATAAASGSPPTLPRQTVAQLLADVQQALAKPPGPLTATVQETANLGLPALGQIGDITGQSSRLSALGLVAGTTTVNLWYLDATHVRIANLASMGEADLRLDGSQLWLWDSKSKTATHMLLPPTSAGNSAAPGAGPAVQPGLTPQAAARQALATLGPSTRVVLGPNTTVANRAAYQIELIPKTSQSLVSQISIDIDAARHIPLQVQVDARGQSGAALQVGFTALTFGRPAMSNFSFAPPPGAKVKTAKPPAGGLAGLSGLSGTALGPLGPVASSPGGSVICSFSSSAPSVPAPSGATSAGSAATCPGPTGTLPAAVRKQIEQQVAAHLPSSMTKAQRAAALKQLQAQLATGAAGWHASSSMTAVAPAGLPRVLGTDWTSVIALPANPQVAALLGQLAPGRAEASAGPTQTFGAWGMPVAGGPALTGTDLAVLRAVWRAGTPVKGSWGSGKLIRSALVSVLVTSKGQILAGAVPGSVLLADMVKLGG